jgi:uncharacterized protein (TIGR03083 family)
MWLVNLWDMNPLDVRPTLVEERRDLLALLEALNPEQWCAPTEVPGWTVKDLALHILDDDLGWLSRGRDSDPSGRLTIEDPSEFVDALAAKNQRWIDGASGLSLPVAAGLLEWAGRQMDDYYATMDLAGEGRVAWASDGLVPIWFDIAQDLTERWVHQMQMRQPLGLVAGYRDAYLPIVLRTFVWALPHQLTYEAPAGTNLDIDLSAGGRWHLVRDPRTWLLAEGRADDPDAELYCSDEGGWRWLTGADVPADGWRFRGPDDLGRALLKVRSILA